MWPFLFLLLPVAATCGWYFARWAYQQEVPKIPYRLRRDYFKGLHYLINEQPDKAVDVFVKLLEIDSDTVETHLALGSLFRRRGEVDRAIRIHQNLIARPQLPKQYRMQALAELGQDYLRAGVLDRAERLFLELVELGEETISSLRFLLTIYQQEKDWLKAIEIGQKLQAKGETMQPIIAHYYCELAEQTLLQGQINTAQQFLKKAQSIDSACVRASLISAKIAYDDSNYKEAIRQYKHTLQQDPEYLSEVVAPLIICHQQLGNENKLVPYLETFLESHPQTQLILAMADYFQRYQGDYAAIEFIIDQTKRHTSLRSLCYLLDLYLLNTEGEIKNWLYILQNTLKNLLSEKAIYRCGQCGFSGRTLYWLCPSCHHWSTIKPIKGAEGI